MSVYSISWAPLIAALIVTTALGGCAGRERAVAIGATVVLDPTPPPMLTDWRKVATAADIDRLARLDAAWAAAAADLRAARRHGLVDDGPLFDAAAGLERPLPSPGRYRCRVVRLGARGRAPGFEAFKPFFCYVDSEGDLTSIVKETGNERPAGRLWPDGDKRLVFLGAVARGRETVPPAYGDSTTRDLTGILERIGPFRWRLAMPWPANGAKLDLLEMIPFLEEDAAFPS